MARYHSTCEVAQGSCPCLQCRPWSPDEFVGRHDGVAIWSEDLRVWPVQKLGWPLCTPRRHFAHGLNVCAPEGLGAQHSTIFENTRSIEACQKVSRQADIIVLEKIAEQANKVHIDGADSNIRGFDSFVEHAHRQGYSCKREFL